MKSCPHCGSKNVKRYGKTALHKQRFRCLQCQRTFIWPGQTTRVSRRQHWFKLWVIESYSVRRLCLLSGYSAFTLKSINNYWLGQMPKEPIDYSDIKYLVYDATYFHKDGCLMNLMNALDQKIIAHLYVKKESFKETYPWFNHLKQQGLDPQFITTDGERSVMRAMHLAWPQTKLQRCLYHLQHEGMRWLRSYPKTDAGKALRALLSQLSRIKALQERNRFLANYEEWLAQYQNSVLALPRTTVAYKDLRRTIALINHALPDMFYYLEDHNVHPTTNALESFHSRLKADYRRHRGLSKDHKMGYIHWYCYFKNMALSNTK